MKKLVLLVLFLLANRSWSAEYLGELQANFKSIILDEQEISKELYEGQSEYLRKEHKKTRTFKEAFLAQLNSSKSQAWLLPAGMVHPEALFTLGPRQLFGISRVGNENFIYQKNYVKTEEHKKTEEKISNAFIDIIYAYWQGYIAFLKELNGENGSWRQFEKDFAQAFFTPQFTKGDQFTYDYSPRIKIQESNKHELLPQFFAHYALGTFFHESKKISPQMRIKALLLWRSVDPDFKFLSSLKKSYNYFEVRKNLLPETFDIGIVEDKYMNSSQFYRNPVVIKIFGPYKDWTQESFQLGLMTLLSDYKQELIQVVHSVFMQGIDNVYGLMALKFLFKLTTSDDADLLGLVLGEHASFRNKGRITLVMDGLEQLGRVTLIDTIRSQKRRISHLEEEGKKSLMQAEQEFNKKSEKIKKSLVNDRAIVLLANLKADFLGWFKTFKVNPMLSFEENQDSIKKTFHKLSLQFHPDKNIHASATEKEEIERSMRMINLIYENLQKKDGFDSYLKQCSNKAKEMAVAEVEKEHGSL